LRAPEANALARAGEFPGVRRTTMENGQLKRAANVVGNVKLLPTEECLGLNKPRHGSEIFNLGQQSTLLKVGFGCCDGVDDEA